jgi:hypothetical protein
MADLQHQTYYGFRTKIPLILYCVFTSFVMLLIIEIMKASFIEIPSEQGMVELQEDPVNDSGPHDKSKSLSIK